nr:ubiquinone biosynthesis monooxygenase COQ6, mitochondrial isoform X1 [Ipomoea batatas]GMD50650.1 ubiquinone biosynthesis monooxygenase COQ6, mitochondrial isoform X1 [Ipomoea batatas]
MLFIVDMGAWQHVQQHRHAFFDKMQVWDYTGLGYTRYSARDIGKEVLGCVVENKVLHGSLLSSIQVGADGSKSRVRELAGIETTGWKYSQSAIICTVEHAEQNHCAWQRFLPNGPIALLPIGDNFSNIVWTMDPKESSERISASENDFVNMVNHALDQGYGPRPKSQPFGSAGLLSWLKPGITSSANERFEVPPRVIKLSSARMVFPLSLMHANSYASKRVVLIGDAAHTVHPLAGQGVNMGFGDAIALSKVIAEGVAVGSDIGEVCP